MALWLAVGDRRLGSVEAESRLDKEATELVL